MAKDSEEILVAGTGAIYIAPKGTALPANESTALPAVWAEVGFTTEDGVGFSYGQEITDIKAWQSKSPVRRIATEQTFSATSEMLQWNPASLTAAFGGGEVEEVSAGHYRFDFPKPSDGIAEYAAIIDFQDGAKKYRLVMPRVTGADSAEVKLTASAAGTLPLSLQALEPDADDVEVAWILTNDPAFAEGS